jgi:twinkle protein
MTMSDMIMAKLEDRGIDVERAVQMGWTSVRGASVPGAQSGRYGEAVNEDWLVIPYYRGERIVNRQYRTLGKHKFFSQDKGGAQIAWNENVLMDRTLDSRPLVITEGALDAMVALQCGFPRTISVPAGAPNPHPEKSADELMDMAKYDWAREFGRLCSEEAVPQIILAVDSDTNGDTLFHDLSLIFERKRCKYVTWPVDAEGHKIKDLNDLLLARQARGVVEALTDASWIRAGVYSMPELPPLAAQVILEHGFEAFSQHYRVRLGDWAVWTGIPGHGKSTLINDLCCRLVERHGIKVAWASFEQEPQRDHRRALRTWFSRQPVHRQTVVELEAADEWIARNHLFIVPDEEDEVTVDWLLEAAEIAVKRHGCKVVVVDPWNEMDHAWGARETEAQYLNRSVKRFRRFARRNQVHLIIVAHPKQLQKVDGDYPVPTLYDINGGAVWFNKADLGVVVHRETQDNTLVRVAKSRFHETIGKPGAVIMQFCNDDRRFTETERG